MMLKGASQLAGAAVNPVAALGAEIGKFLTAFILRSYAEKDEARKTAFYAPGVYEVENELEVAY